MTKMEVVSVRPIPGSNGRGFEVEVQEQQESTTPWRRQRIEEIVAYAEQVDNVGLMWLRDCAEAFAKYSPLSKQEGTPAGTSEAL